MNKIDAEKVTVRSGSKRILGVLAVVVVAFVLGYYLAREGADHPKIQPVQDSAKPQVEAKKAEVWTCSMHPQIRLPNSGKCPICYMDLIPLESDEHIHDNAAVPRYSMSEAAKKLSEVQTTEVKRERATVTVRMVGLVYEDETRVAALTSRVDGRLDEIYINFTGVRVDKGDPMVTIWSPTLIKSQVELFETIRSEGSEEDGVIKGAEEKLIQYGLTKEQVREIREKKKPILNVTLRAPISGIVTKKMALLGQFVKEGSEMYFINDLSHVWIKMDAYETDLPWIRYGQEVTFTTPAVPGRTFKGKVLFIDPMLDTKTRSVKVRVEAENPGYALKPGMFVTAEVKAEVDSKGRVIKQEWAGKYVCPVHPSDEASPEPGTCPISKMPLQAASSFGYADDPDSEPPLVIPASAALVTGKRAVVYVEVQADRPTYEGREVVLGPKAGDKYVVFEGLKEGERVVSKGNFKIDSAMQILAKPSMMSPSQLKQQPAAESSSDEEVVAKLNAPESFLRQLTPVFEHYFILKEALVSGKSEDAAKAAEKLADAVKGVKKVNLDKKAQDTWGKQSRMVLAQTKILAATKEIEKQRKAFDPLSEALVKTVMGFRHVMKEPLYIYFCSDALDRQGAYWIEAKQEPTNPYFGDARLKDKDMLKCAELSESIPPETFGAAVTSVDAKSQKSETGTRKENVSQPHSGHGGEK
ncbi:MAG: efflux RND transporter periplasmic adaptor subunit [Desulfomonile tiedjei]|uniref:Efflux RND transporter periplasmic adaptor subunit n=1 Tax=Desulfomonile tiedjei TaxID=2358 RepID=A0A9D6Z6H6_9BACT|nr:efflux RND transporter periplasmic adaptor subunit [Desulfomonile tiedjei]